MLERWALLVGLMCVVGCGGAAQEDSPPDDVGVGGDVGGSDGAMCFVSNWGIGVQAIRIVSMTRPPNSNGPDGYAGFRVGAVLQGIETTDTGGTELALLLEGEHLMRVDIPSTEGVGVALPSVGDELGVAWGCTDIFCLAQRMAIATASGELVFEGGYISPVASADFVLEYSSKPSGEPCEVRDDPAEGCWRIGTPMHVNVRDTSVAFADGESGQVELDGGKYHVSVLESVGIDGTCQPSETYRVGAVAFIVAVK